MKAFLSMLLCLLLELASLLGIGGGVGGSGTEFTSDETVNVVVELDGQGLLETVTTSAEREKLVESFAESEAYKQITESQQKIKQLIAKSLSKADFGSSYSYCFVLNGFSLEIPYKYIDELEALPGVKEVHISEEFSQPESELSPEDAAQLKSAGLFTGVPEAQESGFTGKGTVIAVLDTGFELSHEAFDFEVESPSLSKKDINVITTFKALNTFVPMWGANYYSQKIPYKWDYAEIDKTVDNEYSTHGTHVAGIIGGKSDTITGVAPDAQLLLMKVFGDEKNSLAKEYVYLAALDDAVKLGADVVNMSLGSPSGQNPDNIFTNDVIKRLERSGIAVICSAGNEASMGENDATPGTETVSTELFDYGTISSPASYDWCVAVAASKINPYLSSGADIVKVGSLGTADIASYSSWGVTADLRLKPEITAPGSDIVSSVDGNSYASMSGTSMAAPYYTGAFALVKQYLTEKYPSAEKTQVTNLVNNLLMSTATPFRGYGKSTYYSPRRQGAGLLNLNAALSTKAYLTAADGTSRPKIDIGEDTDGTLEMTFMAHNLSDEELCYSARTVVLTDSYRKSGSGYVNTLTARKLYEGSGYSLEYTAGVSQDKSVTIPANSSVEISLKITLTPELRSGMQEIFTNGYFIDGFVFLENEENGAPALSIPYLAFDGDWEKAMLFDRTMYDSEPSYLGKQWGLMVTDGTSYYPLGANMFEDETEYGIDTKYCAYSTKALESKLKNPTVTVSVGLIRNGKRMDYNLFTQSGIFRFCGSTLFDYCRKTNNPNKSNIGLLWGGGGGLVDGKSYVYKVSTTPANYPGGRTTLEFPFVVDNQAATVESISYEMQNGSAILSLTLHDNRYIMGFRVLTQDGKTLGDVSFKGIEPDENGNYSYTLDVSSLAKGSTADIESIGLYILDYAYNETQTTVSLSGEGAVGTFDAAALDGLTGYRFIQAAPVAETQKTVKSIFSFGF